MQAVNGLQWSYIPEEAPVAIVDQARQALLQDLPLQFPLLHGKIALDEIVYHQKESRKIVVEFYDEGVRATAPLVAFHHLFTYQNQKYCVSSALDGSNHYTFASKPNPQNPLFLARFCAAYTCSAEHAGNYEKIPDSVRERLITFLQATDGVIDAQNLKVQSCFMNGPSRYDFTLLIKHQVRYVAIDQQDSSVIDFNQLA